MPGFDGFVDDPLGGDLGLTEADYLRVTHSIVKAAEEVCAGRVVSVLEVGLTVPCFAIFWIKMFLCREATAWDLQLRRLMG